MSGLRFGDISETTNSSYDYTKSSPYTEIFIGKLYLYPSDVKETDSACVLVIRPIIAVENFGSVVPMGSDKMIKYL